MNSALGKPPLLQGPCKTIMIDTHGVQQREVIPHGAPTGTFGGPKLQLAPQAHASGASWSGPLDILLSTLSVLNKGGEAPSRQAR